jgi:hypothetical protein
MEIFFGVSAMTAQYRPTRSPLNAKDGGNRRTGVLVSARVPAAG